MLQFEKDWKVAKQQITLREMLTRNAKQKN